MRQNLRGPLAMGSLAAALCFTAPAAVAQDGLEGIYDIEATVFVSTDQVDGVEQNEEGCDYTGTATLVDLGDGVVFSDDVILSKDTGGDECPGELMGTLDATVSDSTLTGRLTDEFQNVGDVTATITDTGAGGPSPRPPFQIGGTTNFRGQIPGSSNFTANQRQPMPFFGPLALALLTLILLASGAFLLLRRRAA